MVQSGNSTTFAMIASWAIEPPAGVSNSCLV